MEQLTIFDVFQFDTEEHDLQALPESDMIRIISERTGIIFHEVENVTEESYYKWYESKQRGGYIAVHYSHYFDDNKRFIAVDALCGNEGAGCPTDSIEEAIQRVKQYARRYGWK